MEGREHTGILVVMDRSKDPAKESAWNNWYERVRMPELLNSGVFTSAAQFQGVLISERDSGTPLDDTPHLSIHETTSPDIAGALAAKSSPYSSQPVSALGLVGIYSRIFIIGDATGNRATGVLVVLSKYKDRARAHEHTEWAEEKHIPEMLDTGAFFAANRYLPVNPQESQGDFLTVYETDLDDPAEAPKRITEAMTKRGEGEMTPNPDLTDIAVFSLFRRTE